MPRNVNKKMLIVKFSIQFVEILYELNISVKKSFWDDRL